MAEDERILESTDADTPSADVDTASESAGVEAITAGDATPDEIADSFFELEDELERAEASGRRNGLVVGAERVDGTAVPDGYPLEADGDRAIALTVDFGDGRTTVYLAWPDDGEGPLTWLLEAIGIQLRDLYGQAVLIDRTDGHDTLVTPTERPRGTDRVAGILGGLGAIAGIVGLAGVTGGVGTPLFVLWLGITLGWLPYAVFTDSWYLRTHSDWDGGPLFWATLSALPLLNLLVGAVYLRNRSRVSFFGSERSLPGRVAAKLRSWL